MTTHCISFPLTPVVKKKNPFKLFILIKICEFKENHHVKTCISRWLSGKESACQAGDAGSIPVLGRPLEKGMATHSSIIAWEIPCTEEPGRPQSMGPQRFGHDQVTKQRQQQQHAKTFSSERAYGGHRDLGGDVKAPCVSSWLWLPGEPCLCREGVPLGLGDRTQAGPTTKDPSPPGCGGCICPSLACI